MAVKNKILTGKCVSCQTEGVKVTHDKESGINLCRPCSLATPTKFEMDSKDARISILEKRIEVLNNTLATKDRMQTANEDEMSENAVNDRITILRLASMCRAAAEELKKRWEAHCDKEGYGPCNLHARLCGKLGPDIYPNNLSDEETEEYSLLTSGGKHDVADRCRKCPTMKANSVLRKAIRKTIKDNAHLADGEDCTLKTLKDAISNRTSP